MSYRKIPSEVYKNILFSKETPIENDYAPISVEEIIQMEMNYDNQKIRIIGYLCSKNGCHYLKNINRLENNYHCEIEVNMDALDSQLASAIIPYPVQIFGYLTSNNHSNILLVKFLHTLSPRLAQLMSKQLQRIKLKHKADSKN